MVLSGKHIAELGARGRTSTNALAVAAADAAETAP